MGINIGDGDSEEEVKANEVKNVESFKFIV